MARNIYKQPTLKEIAEASGVSMATVDRVLTNRAKVSQHTKQKVLDTIASLTGSVSSITQNQRIESNIKTLKFSFVMEGGSAFLDNVERKVLSVSAQYKNLGVELETHRFEQFNLAAIKQTLDQAQKSSDGIIVVLREHTEISGAINSVIEKGTPVVCLTTDNSDTLRIGYSGMNNSGAGRVAGRLMGKFTNNQEGEVILIVSAPYSCQYERELGFRRILREHFPKLKIRESLNNHDLDTDSFSNLMDLFNRGIKPLGIYNTTGGTEGVVKALEAKGWNEEVFYIAHELDAVSGPLLAQGKINVVMDQDLRGEIILAINGLMYHCGALQKAPIFTEASPIVTTRENMGGPLEVDIPSLDELTH